MTDKEGGTVVPLFLTFEESARMQAEISDGYNASRMQATAIFKSEMAAAAGIIGDQFVQPILVADTAEDLSKALAVAKENATRAPADKARQFWEAKRQAYSALASATDTTMKKFHRAVADHNDHARRAMRFARTKARPYYGPGATIVTLEVKR